MNTPITDSIRTCIEKAVTQVISKMDTHSLNQLIKSPLQDFRPAS